LDIARRIAVASRERNKMAADAKAFVAFERMAHDRIAGRYAEVSAPLTSLALDPLFDAARVGPGRRLLDVGTGLGMAAAAAQARVILTDP
jgi:ubiquinone/menaquinone biosynthesis C-methylase UbiE